MKFRWFVEYRVQGNVGIASRFLFVYAPLSLSNEMAHRAAIQAIIARHGDGVWKSVDSIKCTEDEKVKVWQMVHFIEKYG